MSRSPSELENVCDNDNNGKNIKNIRRNITGRMNNGNQQEGRVLVLYTGGTIGMMRNEQGGDYFMKFKKLP